MRLGLIKKSLICVLSLSFCALLASCSKGAIEQSVSKSNVFAQKDILAYAKKNKVVTEEEFVLPEVKYVDYGVYSLEDYVSDEASLIAGIGTNDSKIYTKKANETFVVNDGTLQATRISKVSITGLDLDYAIYNIGLGSVNTVMDCYGNKIIEEKAFTNLSISRIIDSKAINDGDNSFYEVVSYYIDYVPYKDVYRIDAKLKNGKIVSAPTRAKIENSSDLDYAIIDYSGGKTTLSVKDYDVTMNNGSVYVTNTNGKVVSSFQMNQINGGLLLDDVLFYQTTTQVTRNENYTYSEGSNFYLLQTYSVDLTTGVSTEVKNYNYLLDDDIEFVYGYNEKKDRTYIAAQYASLYEIVDKRLSTTPITGMVDKNGKMISTKVGEKGYKLNYLDDNAYVLYDDATCSILSAKGKVKGSFMNDDSFKVDYKNQLVFVQKNGTSGLLLDSDLKVIDYPGRENIICYGVFDNGNALVYMNGVSALVKFNGKKMEIIKSYDGTMTYIGKDYSSVGAGYTCVAITDELVSRNLYIVETKTEDDKWNFTFYNANGDSIIGFVNVSYISSTTTGGFFVELTSNGYDFAVGAAIYE